MAIRGILVLLTLGITAVLADVEQIAVARLIPHNIEKYNVTGDIRFTQATPDGPVVVSGKIYGLTEGPHGFHVHQTGDLSNGCLSMLAHFNPDNLSHGAPEDNERHVGDLGNIVANSDGIANVDITDNKISLSGKNSIVGRGVVVHALVDDLGKGGQKDSRTTGNAGGRVSCGVIAILSPVDKWNSNSGGSIFWSSSKFLVSVGMIALFIQAKF